MGLNPSDIVAALAANAAYWVVERLVEPYGETGFVIMPESGDDSDGPTLVIWEEKWTYRVDEVQRDSYRTVAERLTIAECLTEIRRRTHTAT